MEARPSRASSSRAFSLSQPLLNVLWVLTRVLITKIHAVGIQPHGWFWLHWLVSPDVMRFKVQVLSVL